MATGHSHEAQFKHSSCSDWNLSQSRSLFGIRSTHCLLIDTYVWHRYFSHAPPLLISKPMPIEQVRLSISTLSVHLSKMFRPYRCCSKAQKPHSVHAHYKILAVSLSAVLNTSIHPNLFSQSFGSYCRSMWNGRWGLFFSTEVTNCNMENRRWGLLHSVQTI